jgi:hypothetical protein
MEKSNYNFIQRLLHQLTLGSKVISELSFDINQTLFHKKENKTFNDSPVFISGLARSGTTALLEILNKSEEFCSLTYSDMPFILAPNLNKKIAFNSNNKTLKERAHKDGIYINNESPEALDEVFWKVFLRDSYIQKDRLTIIKISDEIALKYQTYISGISYQNGVSKRYLSKNNNLILRLDSILTQFPKAKIIIPFRDPLQHAISLLNQHLHFIELQKNDPFSLKYMNWLGHHEFGLNQKPFYLGNDVIFDQMKNYKKDDLNYWLLSWLNYYSYVLENYSKSCILFSYEKFCEDPNGVLSELTKKIDLNYLNFDLKSFKNKVRSNIEFDQKIYTDCLNLYSKLM